MLVRLPQDAYAAETLKKKKKKKKSGSVCVFQNKTGSGCSQCGLDLRPGPGLGLRPGPSPGPDSVVCIVL